MLDLIGYWGGVSLQVAILATPWIMLSSLIVYHMMLEITGSEEKAERISDKVYNGEERVLGINLPEYAIVIGALGGILLNFVMILASSISCKRPDTHDQHTEIWQLVSIFAEYFTTPMVYVTLGVVGYYGTIAVGKRVYAISEAINRLRRDTPNV